MQRSRLFAVLAFIFCGALSRLIPHPPNFTAINTLALFGGLYMERKGLGLCMVFGSMFLTDLLIGFHPLMLFVYLSFGLTFVLGYWLQRKKIRALAPLCLVLSSLFFFVVTNYGVWRTSHMYPLTKEGFEFCMVAALPFLRNQILGDLFYGALFFGGFALVERRFQRRISSGSRPTVAFVGGDSK